MSEYLNKWFWIKRRDHIPNKEERDYLELRFNVILKCIGEKNDLLELYYHKRSKILHAYKADVVERPAPDLLSKDIVLIKKHNLKATVECFVWHFNDERYYYYLIDAKGKSMKKRYYIEELEKLEADK